MYKPFNPNCEHYTKPGLYDAMAIMEIVDNRAEFKLYCPIDGEMIGGYKVDLSRYLESTEAVKSVRPTADQSGKPGD